MGLDNIRPGDLIMLVKGSNSALVQVSTVAGQQINFANNDSLKLNQMIAADGTATPLQVDPVWDPSWAFHPNYTTFPLQSPAITGGAAP